MKEIPPDEYVKAVQGIAVNKAVVFSNCSRIYKVIFGYNVIFTHRVTVRQSDYSSNGIQIQMLTHNKHPFYSKRICGNPAICRRVESLVIVYGRGFQAPVKNISNRIKKRIIEMAKVFCGTG